VGAALGDGFAHRAFFYSGDSDYLCTTEPFVREACEAGDSVLVVVPPEKIELLRDALGSEARSVTFEDVDEVGHNPACIIARWREFVDRHASSTGGVRGIGEPLSAQRRAIEVTECHQHESLLNRAFAPGTRLDLICPYDVDGLDPSVVDDARRTHPHLIERGARVDSHSFDGDDAELWLQAPLPAPPADANTFDFDEASLRTVRATSSSVALDSGMREDRVADLVLAVNELATNSVSHGAGSGTLTIWADNGSVICDVFDTGRLIDPLAGRRRPDPRSIGGRGLWLANQLSDLTQLRRTSDGTRIRLHFHVT
jgi:anti-sigma regulatory factor (Ser/Thr protein kinase)